MTENKFLVIGFGNMGSLHVKILTSLIPNVQFDIVDDKEIVVPENSKKIDFKNIENINEYKGIIIATHTESHLDYYEKLKDYERLIFIEKPVVNNLEDLNKLKKLNKKNIFCGFIETHNNLFSIARSNMTSPPFYIQVERISPQIDPSRLKDHVSFDLTIHDVSVVLSFFIDHQDILSSQSTSIKKNLLGLYEMNNLKFQSNNCLVNISSSRLGQKKIRNWTLFTENEQIKIDLIKKEILITRKNDEVTLKNNQLIQDFYEKVIIDTEDNPAKNQMKTYLKCLDNSEIEYNYSNLINSHQILLDSE